MPKSAELAFEFAQRLREFSEVETHRLGAVVNIEFAENVPEVRLHRLRRDC